MSCTVLGASDNISQQNRQRSLSNWSLHCSRKSKINDKCCKLYSILEAGKWEEEKVD